MEKLILILSLVLCAKDGISQNRVVIAKIQLLVKSIDSDASLSKKTEKGRFRGYKVDSTLVQFKTVYYFKNNDLVKVVSTDFRIHETNTRTILYLNRDILIKIEEGFVLGQSQLQGGKAYFVADTSIYRDGEPFAYKTKKHFDSSDFETAKYYQSKAKNFIIKK
jgi:hypothetical protein